MPVNLKLLHRRKAGPLTFDPEGEIIILSGGIADNPAHSDAVLSFLRI